MRKSLSDKIADEIISDYLDMKVIGVGDRMPTMRDLQKRYSVSVSTVSHAIELLVQRGAIEKRPNGVCYVADGVPPKDETGPKLMGYVMSILEHPTSLALRVYRGIDAVCQREGYHLLTAESNYDYEKEQQNVERFAKAGCEAIVVFPVTRTRQQLKDDYLKTKFRDIPIVLVDIAYPEQKLSQVIFDNYKSGYDMTMTLIERGHRRIAIMDISNSGEIMQRSTTDRVRGYLDALRTAGISHQPEDIWQFPQSWGEMLPTRLRAWRDETDHATALIALEDNAAMMAISAVFDMGLSVPNDLLVTGFDNWRTAESFSPQFPTTLPDFERAGEIAASTALQHVRGQLDDRISYVLPAQILWRTTPTFDSDDQDDTKELIDICQGG